MSVEIPQSLPFPVFPWPAVQECPAGFKMRAGSKLIVEARDATAAAEVFWMVVSRSRNLKAQTAKLAPNLFFAQAEETGNYWIFTTLARSRN